MKRHSNLYVQICDEANVMLAFTNAAKGKSHYREVVKMRKDLPNYLAGMQQSLTDKSFRNAEYKRFEKVDRNKRREIYKLPFFPDRVIQHALCQVLAPIWNKQYIRDTFSCIVGRGIHDGVRRLKRALQNDPSGTKYCLKLDIRKYYPSVDNDILKQILCKKIKCKDTLWLLDEVINSTKGIPIGNYTSQHFANLYLSDFDHFVKEQLKVRYYYRYCDDMVLLSNDKTELREWFDVINEYLSTRLKLQVKQNWQIFPVDKRGIDFLGYRFFHGYTLLRKNIVKRYKRRLIQLQQHRNPHKSNRVRSTMASYKGWMKYADCYNLLKSCPL